MNRFDCYLGHVKNRANGRHIHDKGEFVLASEHDNMIDQLLKLLGPGEEPIIFVDGARQADWDVWTAKHRSLRGSRRVLRLITYLVHQTM